MCNCKTQRGRRGKSSWELELHRLCVKLVLLSADYAEDDDVSSPLPAIPSVPLPFLPPQRYLFYLRFSFAFPSPVSDRFPPTRDPPFDPPRSSPAQRPSAFSFGQFEFPDVQMGNCVVKNQKDDDDSDNHVEFSGGNVHLVTTKESWDQKLAEAGRDGKIVIANFSATWCGPCRMVAPYYIELSEKHPSLMFLLVDVDELSDFSSSWDIKATPTFFFLKNGQQIGKLVGANKPELQKKITSIVDSVDPSPQAQ